MGSRNKREIWSWAWRVCSCYFSLYNYLKSLERILYTKNYCLIINVLLIIVWRRVRKIIIRRIRIIIKGKIRIREDIVIIIIIIIKRRRRIREYRVIKIIIVITIRRRIKIVVIIIIIRSRYIEYLRKRLNLVPRFRIIWKW